MSDIDNPSAFPRTGEGFGNPKYDAPGMTLRDWFAGQALPHVLGEVLGCGTTIPPEDVPSNVAGLAYSLADAIAKARSQPSKEGVA